MVELSISGNSKGLVAGSAINLFMPREGTLPQALAAQLQAEGDLELPFQILSVFVDALAHDAPLSKPGVGIKVKRTKQLLRFHTGQTMQAFEFVLTQETFYSLNAQRKAEEIARAFEKMASMIQAAYVSDEGARLGGIIIDTARSWFAQTRG